MNPQQMQAYRQYQQPQPRGQPAARRPGESVARTSFPSQDMTNIARAQDGSVQPPKYNLRTRPEKVVDGPVLSIPLPQTSTPGPVHATPIDPRLQRLSSRKIPYTRGPYKKSQQLYSQMQQQPVQMPMLHPHSTISMLHTHSTLPADANLARYPQPPPQRPSQYHPQMIGQVIPPGTPYMSPQYFISNGQVYPHSHFHSGQPNAQQLAQHQAQLQQQRQQQQNAVIEHQMAQRRARKPTDKNMPDSIEDLIIGDGVSQYKELQDLERKLDYAMQRKRLDLQETYSRNTKRWRTLRIWIRNTVNNQPWQGGALEENAFDFQSAGDSTVRVTIEGKLLPEPEDEVTALDADETPKNVPATDKFTKFFKQISVEFDKTKNNVPDPSWPQVEWKKSPGSNDLDSITFQRKCDETINVNFSLIRDDALDQRYRLSTVLAQTLEMEEADRAEVVMGLWEYIKLFNLQEDEDKRLVRCDDQLKQLFGVEQIYFPQIPDRIMAHLHAMPPIRLPYTIRVDAPFFEKDPEPTIYDIRVLVEDPMRQQIIAMNSNPELPARLGQISQIDTQLAVIVQALYNSKARHDFFKTMAKDPAKTMDRWMSSQRRDLEVILGEAGRGGGEDGSGPEFARGGKDGVWGSEPVAEAVRYMLAKPQAAKA